MTGAEVRPTQADVGGLGQRCGGLVGAQTVLLPQLVALLQGQDDGRPVVPLPLALLLHTVEQLRALRFVALYDSCGRGRDSVTEVQLDLKPETIVLLTDAEVLILQQSCDLRLQGDRITQQDVLPCHLALIAVIEPEAESAFPSVFHDATRVEVAIGRPLGDHAQADEAAPRRARNLGRGPEGVRAAGEFWIRGADGEAWWQHPGVRLVLRGRLRVAVSGKLLQQATATPDREKTWFLLHK